MYSKTLLETISKHDIQKLVHPCLHQVNKKQPKNGPGGGGKLQKDAKHYMTQLEMKGGQSEVASTMDFLQIYKQR